MRGLSLVGLLAGLGIIGVLMFYQLKPSPEAANSLPKETVEKATEAAETMEQKIDQLQQDLNQRP
jgi:hypothetical protein